MLVKCARMMTMESEVFYVSIVTGNCYKPMCLSAELFVLFSILFYLSKLDCQLRRSETSAGVNCHSQWRQLTPEENLSLWTTIKVDVSSCISLQWLVLYPVSSTSVLNFCVFVKHSVNSNLVSMSTHSIIDWGDGHFW